MIEFEAKRFSDSSNNREYVSGERGGIERFKRGHHSAHLKICGMFAYVQKSTILHWIGKVNGWITDLARENTDVSIDWTDNKEQLKDTATLFGIEKIHLRTYQTTIERYHFIMALFHEFRVNFLISDSK